ncbi:hypothetical protein K8R43_06350 [archaeon]|nr:hypothetical protein [archaeon]
MVFLVLVVLVTGMYLVGSVTRNITDETDNKDSFVRNSKGNYWEPLGSNIFAAINDLDSGGIVWLPGSTTITVTDTITLPENVVLDMQGTTIKPNNDFDVIELMAGSQVKNGVIDVSSVSGFSSAAITVDSSMDVTSNDHIPRVHNVELVSSGRNGYGIYLHATGSSSRTITSEFYDINIKDFEYGIYLHNENLNAEIKSNTFSNIVGYGNEYFVRVREDGGETDGNYFQNIRCFCSSGSNKIVWNNGKGNSFDTVMAYDCSGTFYDFDDLGYGHDGAHQCFLSYCGGGNVDSAPWNANSNAYMIFNMKESSMTLGWVNEEG